MKPVLDQKLFLGGLIFGFFFFGCAPSSKNSDPEVLGLISDIEYMCELVPSQYVYFEQKVSHWDEACQIAKNSARETSDKVSRLTVLENLIWELYDPHLNFGVSGPSSPALVPTNSDMAISLESDVVQIQDLRPGSPAKRFLRQGDVVVDIDGVSTLEAARRRIKTGNLSDPVRLHWAVTAELAGYQGKRRSIKVLRNEKELVFELDPHKPLLRPVMSALGHFSNSTCFIRPHNSLGYKGLFQEIDNFLSDKNCSHGIIFDLRDTPSGGNTGVAEPILGLFIDETSPYQTLLYEDGRRVKSFPEQTENFYADIPIVVLVGPWTGSMGEGMAIGFDGTQRAPVLGGSMAKLGGALKVFTLPYSKYPLQLPVRDTLHINGAQRNAFQYPSLNQEAIQVHVNEPQLQNSLKKYLNQEN